MRSDTNGGHSKLREDWGIAPVYANRNENTTLLYLTTADKKVRQSPVLGGHCGQENKHTALLQVVTIQKSEKTAPFVSHVFFSLKL
jgi:hypothetical protein